MNRVFFFWNLAVHAAQYGHKKLLASEIPHTESICLPPLRPTSPDLANCDQAKTIRRVEVRCNDGMWLPIQHNIKSIPAKHIRALKSAIGIAIFGDAPNGYAESLSPPLQHLLHAPDFPFVIQQQIRHETLFFWIATAGVDIPKYVHL